ncbi:MAG: GGDEF domain-containing protein [Proteobacteria bacterium]|nr:GGDEF domain-containing protein [Pseudomonadota bacterium]
MARSSNYPIPPVNFSNGSSIEGDLGTANCRDPLTGFFNQDYLVLELEKTLGESRNQPIAATLALLQLENFYEIRTWVGKAEANLLLSDIALTLKQTLPVTVTLCRCKHFEFAALLLNDSSINARPIIDRVKLAIQSAASTILPPQLELKCGIGLAQLEKNIPSAEVLFARARHQLSFAHQGGDSGLQVSAYSSIAPRLAIQQIQQCLREDLLKLSFQPTPHLSQDDLKHYEVRCRTPNLRELPAALLFEIAVQNALGEALDRWVIKQTLRVLVRKRDSSLRFTINLTLNSLVSSQFMEWLRKTLRPYEGLRAQLVFQISEIDVLIAQHHMSYFCEHLEQLRIPLSINYFGATADPFRYLSLLNAQSVKLHVSLHEKINEDQQKQRELKKMVTKLHKRGLRVIVGNVTKLTMMPLLWKSGIDFVQGHCIEKPGNSLRFKFLKDVKLSLH